jgi:hypothetical protein
MLLLLFAVILTYKLKFSNDVIKICTITLGVSALTLNQNVITGIQVQPGHFHWYFIYPMVFLVAGIVLNELSCRFLKTKKLPTALSILLILGAVGIFQTNSIIKSASAGLNDSDFRQIEISKIDHLQGRYLTFNSRVSYFLNTSSYLNPYYDQDYGIMYPPNIDRLMDFSIIYAKENVQNKYGSEFILSAIQKCEVINETICVGIQDLMEAYKREYGKKVGELEFEIRFNQRFADIGSTSLGDFLEARKIKYFVSDYQFTNLQERRGGLRLEFLLGQGNHKMFFYSPVSLNSYLGKF